MYSLINYLIVHVVIELLNSGSEYHKPITMHEVVYSMTAQHHVYETGLQPVEWSHYCLFSYV